MVVMTVMSGGGLGEHFGNLDDPRIWMIPEGSKANGINSWT